MLIPSITFQTRQCFFCLKYSKAFSVNHDSCLPSIGYKKSLGKILNISSNLGFASSNVSDGGNCKTSADIFSWIGKSDVKNENTSESMSTNLFLCVITDGNFAVNLKCIGVSAFHLLTISWDGIL